uniref:C2 domain-containing protein n=1 Tax=Anopheles christyi TaxID=43041 RepID=A0A182K271_9DIPT
MAADDLPERDESLGYGMYPEAYASIKLLPKTNESHVAQTEVSTPSLNPIWNATITFQDVFSDNLLDRKIEIVLYDLLPHSEPIFLGECSVKLQKACLDDVAVWYRLEDPNHLRGSGGPVPPTRNRRRSTTASQSSIDESYASFSRYGSTESTRFQRSISDDVDNLDESRYLLHPNWSVSASRRGSTQSEIQMQTLEVHQIGKDYSKSLPGSRRSSFQDTKDQQAVGPAQYSRRYSTGRTGSGAGTVGGRDAPPERKLSFGGTIGGIGSGGGGGGGSRTEFMRTMSLSRELDMKNRKKKRLFS